MPAQLLSDRHSPDEQRSRNDCRIRALPNRRPMEPPGDDQEALQLGSVLLHYFFERSNEPEGAASRSMPSGHRANRRSARVPSLELAWPNLAATFTAHYARASGWHTPERPTLTLVADAGTEHAPFIEGRLADPGSHRQCPARPATRRTNPVLPAPQHGRASHRPGRSGGHPRARDHPLRGVQSVPGVYARVDMLDDALEDLTEDARNHQRGLRRCDARRAGPLVPAEHRPPRGAGRRGGAPTRRRRRGDRAGGPATGVVVARLHRNPGLGQPVHPCILTRPRPRYPCAAIAHPARCKNRRARAPHRHRRPGDDPRHPGLRAPRRRWAPRRPRRPRTDHSATRRMAAPHRRERLGAGSRDPPPHLDALAHPRPGLLRRRGLARSGPPSGGRRRLAQPRRLGFPPRGNWFTRVLPWAADAAARIHPRERRARRLLEAGAVTLVDDTTAEVRTRAHAYRVRTGATRHCTCTWVARHGLDRGPCAHLLAVEYARRAS